MIVARTDINGLPIAFFSSDIHDGFVYGSKGAAIDPTGPLADCVEMSTTDWQLHLAGDKRLWAGGSWVAYTPPPPPIADVQMAKISALNSACDAELSAITKQYPTSEINSWPKQEAEARAYQADNTAAVPFIEALAAARGITVADQVTRIIAKADAYAATAAAAVGKRQALVDQVNAIVDDTTLSDDEKRAAIDLVVW